jgi:hypothetical protein
MSSREILDVVIRLVMLKDREGEEEEEEEGIRQPISGNSEGELQP